MVNSRNEKVRKDLEIIEELLNKKEKNLKEIRTEIQSLNQQLAELHKSKIRWLTILDKEKKVNKKIAEFLTIVNELNNEIGKIIKKKISLSRELNVKEEIGDLVTKKKNQQDLDKNKSEEKEVIICSNYQSIHPNFTKELQKDWESKGFGYEETKDWINIGLTINDAEYAYWLKEIKQKDSNLVQNYGNDEELRREYKEYSKAKKILQKILDQNYPKKQRLSIKKLDLSNKELEGHLDLNDFSNLEELYCGENKLTSLNLSRCNNLKRLHCPDN